MTMHPDMIEILMLPQSPVGSCAIPGQFTEMGWWFATIPRQDGYITLAKRLAPITFAEAADIPDGMCVGFGVAPEAALMQAQQFAFGVQA